MGLNINNNIFFKNLKKKPFFQNDLSCYKWFVFIGNVKIQKIASPEKSVFWQ